MRRDGAFFGFPNALDAWARAMNEVAEPFDTAATTHGVQVPMSPFLNDTRIRRINDGRYEGQEIAAVLALVTPKDRVLEMGAGLGVVSGVIACNCSPEAMMSFEANPNLIPHIRALHRLNGLEDRIELRNQVLLAGPDARRPLVFTSATASSERP